MTKNKDTSLWTENSLSDPGRGLPKLCPVCGESFWSEDYTNYVRTTHPGFEEWNRRVRRRAFFLPILLAGSVVVAALLPGGRIPAILLSASFITFFGFHADAYTKVIRKFRRDWQQRHPDVEPVTEVRI